MAQSFAATITNAKHVSMAFCRQQQWLTNRQYTFPHGGWSHEHIDQDKQKENQLRRLLLFVEEGKHEQPTTIAMLQTRSILRQKASLYEKLQERRSRRFYLIQRGRSPEIVSPLSQEGNASFSHYPAFGLPAEVEECKVIYHSENPQTL